MQRQNVKSSNLLSIGYDARDMILEVQFTSGAIYQYDGVPADVHKALMDAHSPGKYFAANVRNTYTATKI